MINPTKHCKKQIAIEHLNLALSLRIEGRNPYSILHLAGAAEEMLGKLVMLKTRKNSLERVIDWIQSWGAISGRHIDRKAGRVFVLGAKNGVKHINGEHDLSLEADIEYEVTQTINRAIENFNMLGLPVSLEILNYREFQRNGYGLKELSE